MLFERNNLTDGTQVTTPRYLQEGSTIVNGTEYFVDENDYTLYTVPSGKILYVTDITLQVITPGTVAADNGLFRDFGATRTLLQVSFDNYVAGSIINYNFSTPIYITSIFQWYSENATADYDVSCTWTGWLEDA